MRQSSVWRRPSATHESAPTAQDLDAQLTALTAAGVEADRIFTDKLSGSAKSARPGLTALLDYARAGDTVVVTAIDRLGRSVAEVTRTITDSVSIESCCAPYVKESTQPHPTGRAVAAIMATLAELELDLGRKRRASCRHARRMSRPDCPHHRGDRP
jgi:DNA invertase Pin-like site-specific DNA recombinase